MTDHPLTAAAGVHLTVIPATPAGTYGGYLNGYTAPTSSGYSRGYTL